MEQHSATVLVSEFLRYSDAQVRRNALTALGALKSDDRFGELLQAALTDPDASVRDRAEDEIVAFGNPPPPKLIEALHEKLNSGGAQTRCYALIGRLRSRGIAVKLPPMPLTRKLRLGISYRREERGKHFPKFRNSALLGCSAGLIALLLYINISLRVNIGSLGTLWLVLGTLPISLIFVLATRRWWRPAQAQPDHVAAAVIDGCLLAFIGGLIAGLFVCLAAVVEDARPGARSVIATTVAGALAVIAVRLGTLLGHGCVRGALATRAAEILTGFAGGVFVLTALLERMKNNVEAAFVWLLFMPLMLAFSCVFAEVDREEYIRRPVRSIYGRLSRPMAAAVVGVVAVAAVFPLIPKRPFRATDTHGLPGAVAITSFPQAVAVKVTDPQIAKFELTNTAPSVSGDLQLALWRGLPPTADILRQRMQDTGKAGALDASAGTADTPPTIQEWLGQDRYYVVVNGTAEAAPSRQDLQIGLVFGMLLKRIGQGPRPMQQVVPQCTLRGTLFPSANIPIDRQSTQGQPEAGDSDPKMRADEALKSGVAMFRSSKYKAAVEFTRAIRLQPELTTAYLNRGYAYSWLQRWKDAISDMDNVLQREPKRSDVLANRGRYYVWESQYKRAIEDFDKAIQLNPNNEDAYTSRGDAYHLFAANSHNEETYLSKAKMDLDKAIELKADDPEPYAFRSSVWLDLNQNERAIDDATQALSLESSNSGAYYFRGDAYLELRKYQAALDDLNSALEYTPGYTDALLDRAVAYADTGKYKAAFEDLDQSLAIGTGKAAAGAYSVRAYVENLRGDYKPGLQDANEALKREPDRPGALKNRGRSYWGLGDYPRAKQDLDKAIAERERFAEAYQFRGDVEMKLGQSAAAQSDYTMARKYGYTPLR